MQKFKYAHNPTGKGGKGRRQDPNSWKHGPDPYTHECYYAWLKHRSQARFRKEEYELTFEQWLGLWTPDTFSRRGRATDSVVLTRRNWNESWNIHNVEIIDRLGHLRQCAEYRKKSGIVRKANPT